MYKELTKIILDETECLKNLLGLLEEQYIHIMKKDVFEMEGIVDKIRLCNKSVAEEEVKRRNIVKEGSMKEIIKAINDKELDSAFREIGKVLEAVKLQKDTNELLIKQQMSFNAQMINIINPRREIKTYNSCGNLSK